MRQLANTPSRSPRNWEVRAHQRAEAFNTTFAKTLVARRVAGQDLDVLLAGDDENVKAIVVGVVEPGGMRSIHTGPLRPAQHLEHLGFVHMAQQDNLGSGSGGTIKFVSP